jgi:hypothetical protein
VFYCHADENRHPEIFETPGFRVALAIANLPGMTRELSGGSKIKASVDSGKSNSDTFP